MELIDDIMNEYRCTINTGVHNGKDYYLLADSCGDALCRIKEMFPNDSLSVAKHNKSCEYHGQNIETEVLDTWVYPKSKIIELRCIDICKQCGEGYGKIYTLFADKFVKEV